MAATALQPGDCITATNQNSNDGGWHPLVPPVLHETYRTSRCALCFQNLFSDSPIYLYDDIPSNPHYKLQFCSRPCRDEATKHRMDWEQQAVSSLQRRNGPPQILSTAILLYRILVHHKDASFQRQIEELQCTPRRDEIAELPFEGTMEDDASQYHEQAVISTIMGMIQCSNESVVNGPFPPLEYIKEMIFRIKINGFSICDGEFVTYGMGLFSTPSFLNHSCHPNAVQSFTFQKGRLPSLFVTAFHDIQPNEEITISYTDTSCPSHVRQSRLATDYFFHCSCEACRDMSLDVKLVGIKCGECISSTVVRVDDFIAPSRKHPCYRCSRCGRTDFDSTLEILSHLEHDLQSSKKQNRSWEELRDTYDRLCSVCHVDSWYVQEGGERYLQRSLDRLEEQREDPVGEARAAGEALRIVEELLMGHPPTQSGHSTNTSEFFKLHQLRYKAAKLRLFMMPDPRQSIQELQDVLVSLSPFYPKEHELIVGLKGCLMNAFL